MVAAIEHDCAELLEAQDEEKSYSLEEFYDWLDTFGDPDVQYELINGEIMEKDQTDSKFGPSGRHGQIGSVLGHYLNAYVLPEKKGNVFNEAPFTLPDSGDKAEAEVGRKRKSKASFLIPDVAFVAAGRIPADFRGPVPAVPDLVAEINSPSDTLEKIHDKIEVYKKAGVRLIWSIFMLDRYAVVYRADSEEIKLLNREDELDGEDVLPGFKLKLSAIFK